MAEYWLLLAPGLPPRTPQVGDARADTVVVAVDVMVVSVVAGGSVTVSKVVTSVVASTVVVTLPDPTVVLMVVGRVTVVETTLVKTMVGAETMQEHALDSCLDRKGNSVGMAMLWPRLKLCVKWVIVTMVSLIRVLARIPPLSYVGAGAEEETYVGTTTSGCWVVEVTWMVSVTTLLGKN
jgi:hypothetical protein